MSRIQNLFFLRNFIAFLRRLRLPIRIYAVRNKRRIATAMLDLCRQMAGKRAPFSDHMKFHDSYDTYDAYDIKKTKDFLFLRSLKHFHDGVFIWIIRNISDTDLKIVFLMIDTIHMTLMKTKNLVRHASSKCPKMLFLACLIVVRLLY